MEGRNCCEFNFWIFRYLQNTVGMKEHS